VILGAIKNGRGNKQECGGAKRWGRKNIVSHPKLYYNITKREIKDKKTKSFLTNGKKNDTAWCITTLYYNVTIIILIQFKV